MLKKKRIICFSRIDAITEDIMKSIKKVKFREPKTPIHFISSVAGTGIEALKLELWKNVSDE
jgi:GTPase involved in cell partitioning and DNA repair